MRINARLDQVSEQNFEYLKQNTGKTVTEIIKHSLELYVGELKSTAKHNNQVLLNELAGIASGPEDLSENVKSYLEEGLNAKYPAS